MTTSQFILQFTAGILLGSLYLGALWLTVLRLGHAERPLSLVAVSALTRILFLLAAFAFLSGLEWKRLVICTAGFIIVRLVATRWMWTRDLRANSLKLR